MGKKYVNNPRLDLLHCFGDYADSFGNRLDHFVSGLRFPALSVSRQLGTVYAQNGGNNLRDAVSIQGNRKLPHRRHICLGSLQAPIRLGYLCIGVVYKKELHYVPVFGQALATLHMMAIDRKKGSRAYEQFMNQGKNFMKRGWWLAMFPEGTRPAPGVKTHYKSGGARFAVATSTPIIPIALNSGECWPRNSISKKPGLITVSVGPMIKTEGRGFEEVQAELVNWIEGEMHVISPVVYGNKATSEFDGKTQA